MSPSLKSAALLVLAIIRLRRRIWYRRYISVAFGNVGPTCNDYDDQLCQLAILEASRPRGITVGLEGSLYFLWAAGDSDDDSEDGIIFGPQ